MTRWRRNNKSVTAKYSTRNQAANISRSDG